MAAEAVHAPPLDGRAGQRHEDDLTLTIATQCVVIIAMRP
jgi:hypothetical protein